MQERTSLVDALEGIGKVERELDDNVEMIALGESENDEGVVVEEASPEQFFGAPREERTRQFLSRIL